MFHNSNHHEILAISLWLLLLRSWKNKCRLFIWTPHLNVACTL